MLVDYSFTVRGQNMEFTVSVLNCPEYANKHRYVIARASEGILWFYGAYNESSEVFRVVDELGDCAVIIENKEIQQC